MNQESYTEMNAQRPAQGILLQKDFGNSKFYQVVCDCGDPEHDITVEVEADDISISIRHYAKVKSAWWARPTRFYFLNTVINRLKLTWQVWTRGYVEYEAHTLMTKQQAFNYAFTLTDAIKDVEEFQKQARKKP